MNTLTGTNPVADDASDTLNWTSTGSTITIAGTAATDTINLEAVDVTCTGCITSTKILDATILEDDLKAVDTPADEECLTYEATAGDFEWQACGAGGGGGSAIVFDIGDDGGNDSNDVAEIATSGDTNGIFTEPASDKILIDLANNWPSADTADAFSSNPTDCGSNLVATAIAANGNLTCSTVNTTTILNDTIGFADIGYLSGTAGNPAMGDFEAFWALGGVIFEGETPNNFEGLLNGGNPTADRQWILPDVSGTILTTGDTGTITGTMIAANTIDFTHIDYTGAYPASNPAMIDNEAWFTDIGIVFEGGTTDNIEGVLAPANITTTDRAWVLPDVSGTLITDGDTDTVTATMLDDTDAPGDEECLTYEATGAVFEWQTCGGGGGSSNSFETMNVPAGTDPVAESATDTLNWTSTGSTITFTGTAATDTINVEAVDVTCTGCLGTTEIAALDISADTNHTCGRSLTTAGDGCAADAELYTDTHTMWFENPTAADDFKSIWAAIGQAYTITSISCESDQTVNFDLQIDDGTPAAVNGSSIACTTFATDAALAGDVTMAAGNRLDLAIASVSGTPTWVSISWTTTKDD